MKGAGAFLTPNLSARIGVRWLLKGAEFCMFHTIPLQEVTQFVSQQAVSANSFGLISLCGNTLLPGDVLYIPPGSIVVEKAVGGESTGIRCSAIFMHCRVYELYKAYRTVYSGFLGL